MLLSLPSSLRRQARQHSEARVDRSQPSRANPFRKACSAIIHHAKRHIGVGIVCAVAYFDPGNWSVDLQAGSQFGYRLLFAILMSGIGAVILQALACKLGCVTGLDLAAHCRLLLHDHPRFPRLVRIVFLYPLYALSELAIISTDLAELLGSAIGLVLIFPSLPLPVAVLLTVSDVIFILALGDNNGRGRPVRMFEIIIIILVLVVFTCFVVLIVKVKPYWPDVFNGFLPSRTLVEPSGLYAAIGILGATVMPHGLYLGSHMATQDRVTTTALTLPAPVPTSARPSWSAVLRRMFRKLFYVSRVVNDGEDTVDITSPHCERDNMPLAFIKAHLTHQIWDIVLSLMGFAVLINSAILVLSGAVFFFGPGKAENGNAAGLFDAHSLISELVGKPAAFIFALALVCSGQSASITATLAGQIVSEGFIQWRISPFLRRILTRLLGLIPAMVVASAVGRSGVDTLLVISQVVLSIVLPFVMFPLIWLTSSSVVMRVRVPREIVIAEGEKIKVVEEADGRDKCEGPSASKLDVAAIEEYDVLNEKNGKENEEFRSRSSDEIIETDEEKKSKGKGRADAAVRVQSAVTSNKEDLIIEDHYIDYSNGWTMMIVAYAIWVVVLLANGYLLVTLAID